MIEKLKTIILVKHCVIYEGVGAFLITVCALHLFGETRTHDYLLMILVFAGVFSIIRCAVSNYNKRRMGFSLVYSIPFGLALWLGQKVDYQSMDFKNFGLSDVPLMIALIILVTLISICMLGFIDKKSYNLVKRKNDKDKKWWVYTLIIVICWLPLFLCFFPGLISNDSAVQLRQAIGEGEWSNWHPVLHTLFIAIPVNAGMGLFGGDLTAGIACSTIMQMTILSVIFGYVTEWVMKLTQKKWIGYLLLMFFAAYPIVSCYAVTMWKDVLFSAVFLLLFIKIYDLVRQKKRGELLRFGDLWLIVLLTLFTGFLRNGGLLIVIMLLIVMWIYYKESWRIVLAGFGGVIIIMMVVQGSVYRALGIFSSPMMESLSVPAQQFAYIAGSGGMDDELSGELSKYANVDCLANNYSPSNADYAKNCFYYEVVEDKKVDFLLLWAKTLPWHLADYTRSYVLHSYGYWYIGASSWVLDIVHSHSEEWLKKDYKDISLLGSETKDLVAKVEEGSLTIVWFGWLGNVGVLFWGVCYAVFVFMYQKKYALLVPISAILIYMLSLLIASPVSWIFRYVYPLLLIMPIIMIICFINDKNLKGDRK